MRTVPHAQSTHPDREGKKSPPDPLAEEVENLAAEVAALATTAKTARTLEAYRKAQTTWEAWCKAKNLSALPAAPLTVSMYLLQRSKLGRKPATLELDLVAISIAHKTAGLASPREDPSVRATLAGLRRRHGTKQTQKAPLLRDDLTRICAELPDSLRGKRDKALLLLGWASACRREELVALTRADVAFVPRGLTVQLVRSKTDQEGAGQKKAIFKARNPDLCPVQALSDWLAASRLKRGPLFRELNRHGQVGEAALSGQSVALIIKRAVEAAGLKSEDYSGHSLRAGLATQAAIDGKSERAIMRQTGHKSPTMARRYIRDSELWTDNVTEGLL